MTTKPTNQSKQAGRKTDQREARRQRHDGKQRRQRILYLIVSGFIALLIIASLVITSLPKGTGAGSGAKRVQYVAGVGTQEPLMPSANHVDGKTVAYNTVPPTSGDHWSTPTQCGVYETEVRDEDIVHNLEHGNVVISYNLPDSTTVSKLTDLFGKLKDHQSWLVVRPYAKLAQGQVAIAAWGVQQTFTGVDEAGITKFYNTYMGNLFSTETRGAGVGIPCSTAQRMAK